MNNSKPELEGHSKEDLEEDFKASKVFMEELKEDRILSEIYLKNSKRCSEEGSKEEEVVGGHKKFTKREKTYK